MHLDLLASVVLAIASLAIFDIAALRWGVDSRFHDVRSDFVKHGGG
jgi:hypothetical protein